MTDETMHPTFYVRHPDDTYTPADPQPVISATPMTSEASRKAWAKRLVILVVPTMPSWEVLDKLTTRMNAELMEYDAARDALAQQERDAIMKALGIHFDAELDAEGSGYEVPMEPEPDYFETLPEAAEALFQLLDKGLVNAEKRASLAQQEIAQLTSSNESLRTASRERGNMIAQARREALEGAAKIVKSRVRAFRNENLCDSCAEEISSLIARERG